MTRSIACARPLALAGMLAAGLLAVRPCSAGAVGKLTVTPDFPDDDHDCTNLSGAACFVKENVRKSCVIVADEGRHARFFSIAGATMIPGDRISLLPAKDENGKKFKEADLEGVAFDAGTYYAVGSHGLSGEEGKKQPSRYFVYRLSVDPSTGRPADLGSETRASTALERKATLAPLIAADDKLKPHIDKVPGEQGVNIEGLAVAGATCSSASAGRCSTTARWSCRCRSRRSSTERSSARSRRSIPCRSARDKGSAIWRP